ncbi:Trifunctional nucleotide phosphoesterase protein YfkN precursor [Planctomycetes bacterium Poly30]|uniref:Trifunctional nucleotide phosphoesterase protein YfkN n=1 Tax=Saltatorellus ferox TaxID=2528018 RepID=A0A518EXP4_9BACT|nr:Trifunctional nucleotide phosphoesterase protein YfkN precursor [Planctomycetes bacterium Poly30]
MKPSHPPLHALWLLLLWLAMPLARANPQAEERHLVVLHTNDIHGQVLPRPAIWLKDVNPIPDSGGLPRLTAKLNELVAEARAAGASVVICDGGDWFQGTPEGQIGRGRSFLGALARAGHDGAVVGNHEFDHGLDVFLQHLKEVPMPALLANVRMPDGSPLPGTRDWILLERDGLRIALVGLLTTSTPSITHRATRDLLWTDPAEALARVRADLGDTVDLVIPVTHIGIEDDRALARAHPDLPLIVGGHSHTFLRTGVREGDTLIVQAGAKASVIGRVDLWLDEGGHVVRSEAQHVDLYGEPAAEFRNAEVDAACAALSAEAAERMDAVLGVFGGPLESSRRELTNSTSGNLITDLMRERSGADVAIHNRGGTRTTLAAGVCTRRDLFMLLPFDNHIEMLTMKGADVIELFRTSIEEERRSGVEFSGVTLEARLVEGKPKLVRVLLGGAQGRAIQPDETIRLATNSYMASGGDGWTLLAEQEVREVDFTLLRDMVEIAFESGPLMPSSEQRYSVIR